MRTIEWWNREKIEYKESPIDKNPVIKHPDKKTIRIKIRPRNKTHNNHIYE